MGDWKGAPALHFNFPLLSFSLYITVKREIAASSEPMKHCQVEVQEKYFWT